MTLYERIRQLRIDAGMSQDDLAKAMGYSDRSMITKIESGKVDISQKKILAFAKILNTTPGYLMGLEDENHSVIENDPYIHLVSGMMENMTKEQKEQIVAIIRAVVGHPAKNERNDDDDHKA